MIRHDHLSLRLGLLYAALFATMGVSLPFLPLWLQARGVGLAEIGVIIGLPVLARVACAPLVTEIADRSGRPVRTMRVAVAATLACYVLLAWAYGFWMLLLAVCLVAAASSAIIPLCDSLAVMAFRSRQQTFGTVRLWGSVSFVGASALAGVAIDGWTPTSIVWLLVGLQGLALAAALACVADRPRAEGPREKAPPSRFLLVPGLVAAVAAAALIQASHAAYYALGSVHWRALGLDGPAIGALWSIGVVAEILLFWGSAWLPGRIGPGHLLLLGAGAAIVRWTAMTADPSVPVLIPLQLLHAFSFAATYLGMMRAAALMARTGLEARVQGMSATVHGLAMAAAMGLSGPVYASAGGKVFGLMAGIAGLGGLVALAGWRSLRSAP